MNVIQFDATPVFLILAGILIVYSAGFTAAYWKLLVIAKKPGWAILLPIYGIYVIGQVAKKPKLALIENILLTSLFLALAVRIIVVDLAEVQGSALLSAALPSFIALLIIDIKLEKYFLKQFTPAKLVNQIKFNLNPFSAVGKLNGVKYKGKK